MTVYFQGTEREDFVLSTVSAVSVDGAAYNASNVRRSLKMTGNAAATYMETTTFSAPAIWTHFSLYWDDANNVTFAPTVVSWYSGATPRIGIYFQRNYIEIKSYDGSSWSSLGSTAMFQPHNTLNLYDVYVKVGNVGVGEVRVYVNGTPAVWSNSVDTTFGGAVSNFTAVRFTSQADVAGNCNAFYSEVIVADWNTIGSRVQLIYPNGAGNYNDWTGAGYTAVDETSPGADFMTSGTANQRFSTAYTDIGALAAGEIVAAVKVTGAFTKDLSAPQSLNYFARIGTTDFDGSDQTAPSATNALSSIGQIWQTSPATSAAWTVTEINGAEFGIRSRT